MSSKLTAVAVRLAPRDQAIIDKLAEQKRASAAGVIRELVDKAIDAGLAV